LYALGDRLYQAIVVGPPGQESKPETQKFFDSFKLTNRAAGQRIAAAVPSAAKESGVAGALEGALKRFPDSPQAGDAGGSNEPRQRQAATPPPARPAERAADANWGALAIDVADSDPSYGIGGGDSEAKASDN